MKHAVTARIRRMTGGYIFSLSTLGGGGTRSSLGRGGGRYPIQPWTGGYPNLGWGRGSTPSHVWGGTPTLDRGGTPSHVWGGTPTLDGGVPHLRGVPHPMSGGSTPGTPPNRNSKHLLRLRGGRCASCVHAGGLSCYEKLRIAHRAKKQLLKKSQQNDNII